MPDKRTKILMGHKNIPCESLYNYIQAGIVTLSELIEAGLETAKIDFLKSQFLAQEDDVWKKATITHSPISYAEYISVYPEGNYVEEARQRLAELENEFWVFVYQNVSEESLREYIKLYPTGGHRDECMELLNDLPWLETRQRDTILAYMTYEQNYPGLHTFELKQCIKNKEDERDWENALNGYQESDDKKYIYEYLDKYSPIYTHRELEYVGKHEEKALDMIKPNPDEFILEEIKQDKNAYPVESNDKQEGIRNMVENGKITWKKLEKVFTTSQLEAIRKWNGAQTLPQPKAPKELISDSTEVYVWGTKGTGKTCCLGAVLSSAKRKGIFAPQSECTGYNYMIALSNLFASGDGKIFTLPPRTLFEVFAEMGMTLTDEKQREHSVTMIDIAGEMFSGVYKAMHETDFVLLDGERRVIEQVQSFLKQKRNETIHFFVVEYGGAYKYVEELQSDGVNVFQSDVLQNMTQFLKKEKIFSSSTVGVYILVTKCDKIPGPKEERGRIANEYVRQHYAAFYNELEKICKKNNISEFKTLAFSIGDVFAQELCEFDGEDTNKVIDKILRKTHTKNKWFDWLKK